MPQPGYKSIIVPRDVYDRFRSYVDRCSDHGISKNVSHMLEEHIIQDKVVRESNPIRKISSNGDVIVLRDYAIGQTVKVGVRDGELYCNACKDFRCMHCGFCYGLPGTYRMLKSAS